MFEKTNNIETILSSLDGIKRPDAPPFLYTRIQARLNSTRQGIFENLINTFSKPVTAISFLFLILIMNFVAYQYTLNISPDESKVTTEDFIATGDFEGMLFYEILDRDYPFSY